ncbi:hypothetical protein ACEPAF_2145 [Sanghuangporus sanghuang]
MGRTKKSKEVRAAWVTVARKRHALTDKTNSKNNVSSLITEASKGICQTRSISGTLDKLADELRTKEQELIEMRQTNINQSKSNCTLQSSIESLENRLADIRKELFSTKTALTIANKHIDATQTQLTKYMNGFFNTRKSLEKKQNTISSLRQHYSALTKEMKQLQDELTRKQLDANDYRIRADMYLWQISVANLRWYNTWTHLMSTMNQNDILLKRMLILTLRCNRLEKTLEDCRKANHRCRTRLANVSK